MSSWRERLDDAGRPGDVTMWLLDNYHYPTLALLAALALWFRVDNWGRFVVAGNVQFTGNDPYYHLRSVRYVVDNWPATMPFDPWTNFPTGTSSAQFGTLFDQLIATVALVVGLGNPGEELIRLVLLFAPAMFGVAALVPTYFIGRRLGGRFGGVVGVAIVGLAASDFLVQSSVGSSDHHVAEAVFQALAVLGVMVAVSVAEREKPVYELMAERAYGSMRRTIGWSLLAGVAIGVYLSVWPPGVLLLGILGVFFFIHLSAEFLRGRSPEHVAIAAAITLTTAGILALSTVNALEIRATSRSLLQPGMALGVAAGCVFMAWLSRVWEDRDLLSVGYPAAVFGVGVVLIAILALVAPDVFGYLINNVRRVVGFQLTETAGTVGEAQPLQDPSRLTDSYKLGAIIAAVGAAGMVIFDHIFSDEPRGEWLLVVVWAIFLTAAVFTQRRFLYYLAIPIAALTALLVGQVVAFVRRTSRDSDGIEGYQVLTIGTIILVLVAPLVIFQPTAIAVADNRGSGGGVVGWQPGLDWLDENTPVPGQYATPDGQPMDILGTFERTADFDYPPGAYGVLSWWDYGHWITAIGNRIPNANPFQQGATDAAQFLLAQNESQANSLLEATDEDDAKTRYVVVDWKIVETETAAGGKFFAPPAFVEGTNTSDYYSRILNQQTLEQTNNLIQATTLVRHKPSYYHTMVSRLYHYHGSGANPRPVVLSWQGAEREYSGGTFTFAPSQSDTENLVLRVFQNMQRAEEYVAESPGTRQIGGIGANPADRIPALEHYRLVHLSNASAARSQNFVAVRQRAVQRTSLAPQLGYPSNRTGQLRAMDWLFRTSPGWTKTFERVPGATIEGTGPPNETVTARLSLQPSTGMEFQYEQQTTTDETGAFRMTVPYASTGYDDWGLAEGYTNTSVRTPNGTDAYTLVTAPQRVNDSISQYVGEVSVTEGQVLGENESVSRVTMTEQTSDLIQVNRSQGDDGNATAGNETGTDGATGDTATGTESGNSSTGSIVEPPLRLAEPARVPA